MSKAEIYSVVIGTAGHIDHGKSSIVRCLTGVDPDRLPEEKDRGLTIDLGFAPLRLPSGEFVGVIDVPGHERFVKNMVAGASGIDLVVLVVAADDSVMPQTREHLDIMTLLGLERGLIVINKIDLVEPEMVDLVEEEIRELVTGTFLEGAPAYRVSAETGAGFDAFREALFDAVRQVPERAAEGVFRMPIQRVFSAKGFGTVVTGVPVSGSIVVGDRLEILPPGIEGRVRGAQAYRMTVTQARAGHSTALNLSDIDYRSVVRGMVAATPGYFRATAMVEARVRILSSLRAPVRHQTPIRFHTGTSEATGHLYLLDRKSAEPGSEVLAQFRLSEPIVVAPGDRYVVRHESPVFTLGGGEVIDRSSWRLKLGKQYVIDNLERKEAALGSREDFVLSLLLESPFAVAELDAVARHAGLPAAEVRDLLALWTERGELVPGPGPDTWLARDGIERGTKRITHALQACYEKDAYRVSIPKLELNAFAHLPPPFFEVLIQWLHDHGELELQKGGKIAAKGRAPELSPDEQAAYELIDESYRAAPFSPPGLEELAAQRGVDLALLGRVHALLLDQQRLVRLDPTVVVHRDAVAAGMARIRDLFETEGPFKAARAKDVLETSRKFAIPFLEYLDRLKVTRRVGDERKYIG
ncbi:MAG: selenocysteine-specific translation elongation factor [Planctomycetota bacterium]